MLLAVAENKVKEYPLKHAFMTNYSGSLLDNSCSAVQIAKAKVLVTGDNIDESMRT